MLDDCAQGIFSRYKSPNQPFGSCSDFALYSYNKFCPVLDGALLLSMRPDIDISFNGCVRNCLAYEALDAYEKHLKINNDLFNESDYKCTILLLKNSRKQYDIYYNNLSVTFKDTNISDYSTTIIKSLESKHLIESITPFVAFIALTFASFSFITIVRKSS